MLQVGIYLPQYTDYFIDNSYPVSVYSCIIGKTTQANANPNEYNTFACVLLASDMKCWANKIFNQSSNTGSVLPITWK